MKHDTDLFLHAFQQQLDERLALRKGARPLARERAKKAVRTRRRKRYENDILIRAKAERDG